MNLRMNTSTLRQRIIPTIYKRKVVIIAILALVLFGYAFLQINAAVTNDPVSGVSTEGTETTPQKRINFSQDDINAINRLSGEEAEINTPTSSGSENPFDGE